MGFKPMTLSPNISAHEILKQKAYKILALMGFKPMTLSKDIFQLMKYQRKELIKFWL